MTHAQGDAPTLRELFPHLTDDELAEAEASLDRYLALTQRIYERIRQDPEAYARFKALTASRKKP